jgi:hypothetical protein
MGADTIVRTPSRDRTASRPTSSGAVYCFGFIGAAVWFWQQASGVGEHLVGILKAFVWPAFLVYEAFQALQG